MSKEQIIGIIVAAIIGISGWVTFLYNYISNQPKIIGRLFTVVPGAWQEKNMTTYLCYLYLTNQRKAAVHLLDYDLEVDFGEGFNKLNRVYGLGNRKDINFFDMSGKQIVIPDFHKQLIYNKDSLVQFGIPIHGFIMFAGDASYYGKKAKRYRLTCIDAFGKKHIVVTKPEDFGNLYLLQDLTGIRFPR